MFDGCMSPEVAGGVAEIPKEIIILGCIGLI